jgi:excisionase family DNA binding protein
MSTETPVQDTRSSARRAVVGSERQWTSTMASEDRSLRVKARMPKTSARGRLLTLAQAAERVQLSRWTLRRAVERGELDGFRFGRCIRVSEEVTGPRSWVHLL